jgi:hypothetical protein
MKGSRISGCYAPCGGVFSLLRFAMMRPSVGVRNLLILYQCDCVSCIYSYHAMLCMRMHTTHTLTCTYTRVSRVRGRVIPTARRCVYNAMLMATPRLMEPVYLCEILCPEDTVDSIHKVSMRSGCIVGGFVCACMGVCVNVCAMHVCIRRLMYTHTHMQVLNRRRGHVHSTSAKAGTPLHTVQVRLTPCVCACMCACTFIMVYAK